MITQATFINATTLALNGLTGSAQSYGAGAKTGIYPISNFTDGSASSQYVDSNGALARSPAIQSQTASCCACPRVAPNAS